MPSRPSGDPDITRCRCGLLPRAPAGQRWWWPSRDREPEPAVRAVAICGQDPALLHHVRVAEGWHTRGAAASYADQTPPRPWSRVGRCWAQVEHPVVDVTAFVELREAARDNGASLPRPREHDR